jgi:hypothetical protein
MFDELIGSPPAPAGHRTLDMYGAEKATAAAKAVEPLIAVTDINVRHLVGECFATQLRLAAPVHNAFFAGCGPAPGMPFPADTEWVGRVAVALIAWAMAQTVEHGFAGCVDGAKAKVAVTEALTPSNAAFVALARANYDALFPANWDFLHCRDEYGVDNSGTVTYPELDISSELGSALADAITSDAFISKEMLTFAANPAAFYQKIYLLLYKVLRLNPSELDNAKKRWTAVLESKGLTFPWTIYQAMQSDCFSEQTFLSEVQAVINQQTSEILQMPPRGIGQVQYRFTYGGAAAQWLDSVRQFYPFFTTKSPENVEVVWQ